MTITKEQTKEASKRKPKSTNIYVDNAEFLKEIIQYQKDCRKAKKLKQFKPKIPESTGKKLLLIAQNRLNHSWFMGYTQLYKEEMIGDAIENCIMYFDNFNPRKYKNPFAYYSQICYFAFRRRIDRERKHLYGKYKMIQQSGVLDDFEQGATDGEESHHSEVPLYENMSEFIGKYEDSMKEKKKKQAKAKAKVVKK